MKKSKLKNVLGEYQKFWSSLDKSANEVQEEESISCTKGCDACCKQVVIISLIEALAIIYAINQDEVKAAYFNAWISPKIHKQRLMCLSMAVTSKTWFDRKTPCILLQSSGECWGYDYRPAVCRAILVRSDPKNCGPPAGQKMDAIYPKGWLDISKELSYNFADKLNLQVGVSPFPMAMYWANMIYNRGMDEYKKSIKDTAFEDNKSALVYWSQRFGSKEMSVEVDKLLK